MKRILSAVVSFCLVLGILYGVPMTTNAEEAAEAVDTENTEAVIDTTDTEEAAEVVEPTPKSVMLGAGAVRGGQASNIYFGTYKQSGNESGGYNIDPIKWRVIENANDKLFLISDQSLDAFPYHLDNEDITWEKSTLRSWLNGYDASSNNGDDDGIDYKSDNFINTAFDKKEQSAIAITVVENADNMIYLTDGGNDTSDKIFILSETEINNELYFPSDISKAATITDYVASGEAVYSEGDFGYWWLRSPGQFKYCAVYVSHEGELRRIGNLVESEWCAVRPVFNMDLNSVIFTSSAQNSKPDFSVVSDYSGSDWKVTVRDGNDFSVGASMDKKVVVPGEELTITHKALSEFADAGYTNVTVALENSKGELVAYGSVNNATSATASVVKIPDVIEEGAYTISVYAEEWNEAKSTDFATGTPLTQQIIVTTMSKVEILDYDDTAKKITIVSPKEYTNAALIVTEYKEDSILSRVEINDEVTISANAKTVLDVPNGFSLTGDTKIKIMLWENLETIHPLCTVWE